MNKFYWFGDSWVYGDELDDPKSECFAKLISDEFGVECINLGTCMSSIDDVVYKFMNYRHLITDTDCVFVFLTERNRVQIGGKHLLVGTLNNHSINITRNLHPYTKEWYKFFDTDLQQQQNLDRNLLMLHSACNQAMFANIFSYNSCNFVPDNHWLVPSYSCIAEYILPYVNKGFILADHPGITAEEWKEQKEYVKKYFKPCFAHPNKHGHKKIAEELCKLIYTLNWKTV